ncbi:septal ring lytic transglycosylase RlpA family protein [Croceicoccus marinus]|uniref:septal ring lytic transglycosylase RlpA family protein n=1 Tax=Croceicoccus marinus TaxID=450378 RepID=UPI000A9CA52F
MDHSIEAAIPARHDAAHHSPEQDPAHHLPSRRERLRMLLRLKSQRQLLAASTGALAGLAAILSFALYENSSTPDLVRLGGGVASVEAQPVVGPQSPGAQDNGAAPAGDESHIGSGEASYYGRELAGNPTASGEIFDPARLTAAHRTLPLGSRVRVTNASNGEDVVVRINDRGPFHGDRVIDLSLAAARTIGLFRTGTARVSLALLLD